MRFAKTVGPIGLLCVLSILSVACDSVLTGAKDGFESSALNVPDANYLSVAWLSDSQYAFSYDSVDSFGTVATIGVFDSGSGEFVSFDEYLSDAPLNPYWCNPVRQTWVTRISETTIGYIELCSVENLGRISWINSIKTLDLQSTEVTLLQTLELRRSASGFAISPDGSEIVQHMGADALSGRLIRFPPDRGRFDQFRQPIEVAEELIPEYRVVSSPSWSESGIVVLAAGEGEAGQSVDPFVVIDRQVWSLLIIDPMTGEAETLLGGLKNASRPKWSPDNTHIAFNAEYKEKPGLWLLELASGNIERVWPRMFAFDWSPDRARLVVLDDPDGKDMQNLPPSPVVVHVAAYSSQKAMMRP